MKDYRKLVPRTPPEGLLAFAGEEMDTAGLVYEAVWVRDERAEAMLTRPERKTRAVRCTCSACGQSAIMEYAPPAPGYRGEKACFGFYTGEDCNAEEVVNGGCTLCPVCGSPVSARCASRVGRRSEFASAEVNVMSASLLAGEPGERPLVLTGWNIRRLVNRYGQERYSIRPLEAYIFEQSAAYKLNGWSKRYSGTAGYFMSVDSDWRQPNDWRETWGQVDAVFGLTPELVAESCLPNSKFDVYMEPNWRKDMKSPVPYLRLYQRRPQVENLVVQGVGYILDELFSEEMQASKWEGNCRGLTLVPDLDLEESRPAQMLGLTKEEFACMRKMSWGLYHWRVFVRAKEAGDAMKLPEDITLLHEYGNEDIEKIIGRAPVGKTLRYLLRAMREWAVANDPYNEYADEEYADYADDDDLLSANYLADYWDMAGRARWDLTDPAVRWPKNLFTAHDRAMEASEAVENEKLTEEFKRRYQELSGYAYASGGLMIVPAASQGQLTKEGAALHHCVAGYGKNHALGKTAIFFIREAEHPKKPYFTLEFDEEKKAVRQNRGRYNCARTPEVEAFEAEWLAWVKAGCMRDKDGKPRVTKEKEGHAA